MRTGASWVMPVKTMARARELAPPAPPCFADADEWVSFICWAQLAMDDAVKPINAQRKGERHALSFNPLFAFCADCTPQYRTQMQAEGRCRPDWLAKATTNEAAA